MGSDLFPVGQLVISKNLFDLCNLGHATGILWIEVRDAAKHLTGHRVASHNKEFLPRMSVVLKLRTCDLGL